MSFLNRGSSGGTVIFGGSASTSYAGFEKNGTKGVTPLIAPSIRPTTTTTTNFLTPPPSPPISKPSKTADSTLEFSTRKSFKKNYSDFFSNHAASEWVDLAPVLKFAQENMLPLGTNSLEMKLKLTQIVDIRDNGIVSIPLSTVQLTSAIAAQFGGLSPLMGFLKQTDSPIRFLPSSITVTDVRHTGMDNVPMKMKVLVKCRQTVYDFLWSISSPNISQEYKLDSNLSDEELLTRFHRSITDYSQSIGRGLDLSHRKAVAAATTSSSDPVTVDEKKKDTPPPPPLPVTAADAAAIASSTRLLLNKEESIQVSLSKIVKPSQLFETVVTNSPMTSVTSTLYSTETERELAKALPPAAQKIYGVHVCVLLAFDWEKWLGQLLCKHLESVYQSYETQITRASQISIVSIPLKDDDNDGGTKLVPLYLIPILKLKNLIIKEDGGNSVTVKLNNLLWFMNEFIHPLSRTQQTFTSNPHADYDQLSIVMCRMDNKWMKDVTVSMEVNISAVPVSADMFQACA